MADGIEEQIAEAVENGASEIILRQPVHRDKDGTVSSSFMVIIHAKVPGAQATITAVRNNPSAALRAALSEHKMRYGSPAASVEDAFG